MDNTGSLNTDKTVKMLIGRRMKMADAIQCNYKLLSVLERLGIQLGFGDASIEKICDEYGISTELFLMVCNIHSFDDFFPKETELRSVDIRDIVDYLHKSHQFYIRKQVPKLKRQMDNMVSGCEEKYKLTISKFFDSYVKELLNHFEYEELNVFPYIRDLANSHRPEAYSIHQFEENHSNIEEKLDDLKNIIIKYLPGCDSTLLNEVLYDIFLLEEDIHKHTLIENKILIPYVSELEKENER